MIVSFMQIFEFFCIVSIFYLFYVGLSCGVKIVFPCCRCWGNGAMEIEA